MRWTLLAALPLLLVGCTSSSSPDFVVPEDADPEATIRSSGNGTEAAKPYVLTIEVRHETSTGPPVAGAAVVFFEASEPADVEAARTGPDGNAVARFFIHGTISIAAGGIDGRTVEELRDVILGDPGEEARVTIVLYEAAKSVEVTGGFPNGIGTSFMPAFANFPLPFADGTAQNAYLERLDGLDVRLAWANAPTEFADLYVGIHSDDDVAQYTGDDERQLPSDAANQETLTLEPTQAKEAGRAAIAGGGLELQALSDYPVVTLDNLPLVFYVEARFVGSGITIG